MQIAQSEVERTIKSIRLTLKYILSNWDPKETTIKNKIDEVYRSINKNLTLSEQFELTLPIIPFLLEYKLQLGAGVDLEAVWRELTKRITSANDSK